MVPCQGDLTALAASFAVDEGIAQINCVQASAVRLLTNLSFFAALGVCPNDLQFTLFSVVGQTTVLVNEIAANIASNVVDIGQWQCNCS